MPLFFAYGVSTDPERMQEEMGGYKSYQTATLPGHACTFTYNPEYDGGATTLLPSPGDEALGAVYVIEESQLALLEEVDDEYELHTLQVRAGGELVDAYVLLPREEETLTLPSPKYLERVRKGLSVHHPAEQVEAYLQAGIDRVNNSDRH
ncbi:gamma-glutamyl AIG2-like cyclotransferase [Tumebacillus sp. BK434]|uniref:gamma-glutamylcyclotransferase family protein n=1 Tax=Tumebacillus sp. BK434 TaxID=2512169 RepID=UPI00104E86FE|nr:gamma-glutamylcyclotransferase family protein [Tumebacillus sp. BK434]TCP53350.1 gamma-glutamyl AIG2-like cyclotransferase [Tumebacillus sp. BK434]